jgi:hypothetical protein
MFAHNTVQIDYFTLITVLAATLSLSIDHVTHFSKGNWTGSENLCSPELMLLCSQYFSSCPQYSRFNRSITLRESA